MKSEVVRLFQTLPHACGYFAQRTAQNLVIDPAAAQLPRLYELAMSRGYRRGGGHVYRPNCNGCKACVPARVVTNDFRPDRSQRRCAQRNADLRLNLVKARYTDEYFQLYRRYLNARHPGGGMDDPDPQDFSQFLFTPWSPTNFLELRLGDRLVAVAVTDCLRSGLSAVYTFFDPDESARGLGTYAILRQIALAREHAVPYVYLGFWIEGHAKMDYKSRFRPLQLLAHDGWRDMP
ncbi:MAG TPA: arginyltransferase [Rudaea sp.]|nr:arginyltransferase [Rudaea sp.]